MTIDFGRPFAYVFEDQDWLRKLLLGAVHALGILLCYLGFFPLMGWQKRVILATAEGRDVPLPEWDRFGEDFVEGLKMFVIWLVYFVPVILVSICAGTVSAILTGSGDRDMAQVGAIVNLGSNCLVLPLQLAAGFLGPVGVIRYVNSGRLGDAFAFGEVFAFAKSNFTNVLLVFVIGIAAQIIAALTILALCIGIFFGIAYQTAILGQARGQLLRIYRSQGLQPAG